VTQSETHPENRQPTTVGASSPPQLPELLIDAANLPAGARKLADLFAADGRLFLRGRNAVKVVEVNGKPVVQILNHIAVVDDAHRICRPVIKKCQRGEIVVEPVTLPLAVAKLFAEIPSEWGFRPLKGVSFGPILAANGEIRTEAGYDKPTGLWCVGSTAITVSESPSAADAKDALARLREPFATFPFADRQTEPHNKDRVDLARPPGRDESTYLVAVLTALCRPSVPLSPAILIRAPALSGAGTGKGLLARAAAVIANGFAPDAVTRGADGAELDKRLAASLVKAEPFFLLDNVNGAILRSNLLEQVITENPCSTRILGRTQMVPLETRAVVCVTGNGIDVSEDLVRRFIVVALDAREESPELREFDGVFLDSIRDSRNELASAALTIWRWGRQNAISRGLPLGSFELWARWARDPLLALGCADPVARIAEIKRDDPERLQAVEFLTEWHVRYGQQPTPLEALRTDHRCLAGSHGKSRQALALYMKRFSETRIGGFHVIRETHGKWGASKYIVTRTEEA
jgi:hypothetical protein